MARTRAQVDYRTLALAREAAGYAQVEDAARRLSFAKENHRRLADMEAGKTDQSRPTPNQVRELAQAYAVSEGLLYMSPELARRQIPDIDSIRDFRLGKDRRKTPELIRLLREVVTRQKLLREILDEDDIPDLSWIGAYKAQSPTEMANALRTRIWRDENPSPGLNEWIRRVEERMGVAVMQPRPHHSRSIKGQLSGVAISDDKVPVVVLNTNDKQERRLFTLLHELAHLMIKAPGISKVDGESDQIVPEDQAEESLCDAVAANTLIPAEVVSELWDPRQEAEANVARLSNKMGGSASACAVRACRLGHIDESTLHRLLSLYRQRHKEAQERPRQGGDSFRGLAPRIVARERVGPRMTLKSLLAFDEGRISALDLHDIFGVRLKHLTAIAKEVGYELVRWRPPPEEMHES